MYYDFAFETQYLTFLASLFLTGSLLLVIVAAIAAQQVLDFDIVMNSSVADFRYPKSFHFLPLFLEKNSGVRFLSFLLNLPFQSFTAFFSEAKSRLFQPQVQFGTLSAA